MASLIAKMSMSIIIKVSYTVIAKLLGLVSGAQRHNVEIILVKEDDFQPPSLKRASGKQTSKAM